MTRSPITQPGEIHQHQCGFDPLLEDPQGCGFIIDHAAPVDMNAVTDEQYALDHTCPRCGKGPWRAQYHQAFAEMWAKASPAERAAIRIRIKMRLLFLFMLPQPGDRPDA